MLPGHVINSKLWEHILIDGKPNDISEMAFTKALQESGLSAERRQELRFGRALILFEQGEVTDAKRDLLIASRLETGKNRAEILMLLAKIAVAENLGDLAARHLYDTWTLPDTPDDSARTEQIVSILASIPIGQSESTSVNVVNAVAVIGTRLEHYTEKCRCAMLRTAQRLLHHKLPAWAVPLLATTIARFHHESDDDSQLWLDIQNTIVRFGTVDSPRIIEAAVAMSSLVPLLARRLESKDNKMSQEADKSVLSQAAVRTVLQALDTTQRQRLLRFARLALDLAAARNQGPPQLDAESKIEPGRLIVMSLVLRGIVSVLAKDGSISPIQRGGSD